MNIGRAGQWDHPAVREAERFMVDTALRRGVVPRAEISEPAEAKRHLDMGVRHFCMGWDMTTLHQWFASQGAALRDTLGVAPPEADGAGPASRYGKS
jgi:4-hydroxy-2-oxoheptanedioate aldolase